MERPGPSLNRMLRVSFRSWICAFRVADVRACPRHSNPRVRLVRRSLSPPFSRPLSAFCSPHVGSAQRPPTPGHVRAPTRAIPPMNGPLRHGGTHTHSRAKPPPSCTHNKRRYAHASTQRYARATLSTKVAESPARHGQHAVIAESLAPEARIIHPVETRNHRRRAIWPNHRRSSDNPWARPQAHRSHH